MIITACFTLPAEIFSSVADLSGFMTLDCQLDCHKIGLCLGSRYLYFLQLFVGCRYHMDQEVKYFSPDGLEHYPIREILYRLLKSGEISNTSLKTNNLI